MWVPEEKEKRKKFLLFFFSFSFLFFLGFYSSLSFLSRVIHFFFSSSVFLGGKVFALVVIAVFYFLNRQLPTPKGGGLAINALGVNWRLGG
jgi:hypothetical protein